MANVYVAPNFDIDTSTNVAGLTALKGGAPAVTDIVNIVNAATVTIEAAVSLLIIKLGETSAGDPGAGLRRGNLIINPGVTVTWGGAAAAVDSGIKSNPGTTGAETKNNTVTISGNYGSHVIMNNQGGAAAAAQQYGINMAWGTLTYDYLEMRNSWGAGNVIIYPATATYTNSIEIAFGHLFCTGLLTAAGSVYLFYACLGVTPTLNVDLGYVSVDITGMNAAGFVIINYAVGGFTGNQTIRSYVVFGTATHGGAQYLLINRPAAGGSKYMGFTQSSSTDIRGSENKIAVMGG